MFSDVEEKLKKKNKMVFDKKSLSLQRLNSLMAVSSHRTLVLWAFDCMIPTLKLFDREFPKETRPRKAVELSDKWSRGEVKMSEAKRAILDCHAVGKEIDELNGLLCHGIGQGCSTVHVKTHGIGLPIYELSYLVKKRYETGYENAVREKITYYEDRLYYWRENTESVDRSWARFL